jgi:hypothetical protein
MPARFAVLGRAENVLIQYLRAAHDAAQDRANSLAADLVTHATVKPSGKDGERGPNQQQRISSTLSALREAERHVGRGEVLLALEVDDG